MSTITLTPAQHAILAHALEHSDGRIDWFPEHIQGGARRKVLDGLANRALIARQGEVWVVADAGYEALGVPRPGARTAQRQSFVAKLDAVIARAEQAQTARDEADLEAAVNAAEAAWAQDAHRSAEPRRPRAHSKQAQRPCWRAVSSDCATPRSRSPQVTPRRASLSLASPATSAFIATPSTTLWRRLHEGKHRPTHPAERRLPDRRAPGSLD